MSKRKLKIERDLGRILSLLATCIHARGFTPEAIQQALGWGRGDVDQILDGRKPLQVDQLLLILAVIDVAPEAFFGDLYGVAEPN